MVEATPTKTVLMTRSATSKDHFRIPKQIVRDGKLQMLSGDSLALYIFLAHSLYRRRKQACLYANRDLGLTLDMPLDAVREARQELRAHRLIDYKQHKGGYLYWFSPTSHNPH